MAEKRILLAYADTAAVAEFRQALGEDWDVATAVTGTAALEEMEKNPANVVVADLDLPEVDGAELLSRVRAKYPKTVLFILATEADKERIMQHVLGAHQFLIKPVNPQTLKDALERALALDVWIASNSMRELVARVRTFPTVPSLYLEVLAALRSPNSTTEQVGQILAKDMSMMTKLLQVINSAYFGLSRKITDPVEAVGILGFDAVKSMVMSIKLLSQYDKLKPVYFSIDKLWRHSTAVARTAKQLMAHQTGDRAQAETAFTAGLMHDMGKVVLASNFDEQYRGAQSLARKQKLPVWEVEKEIFGASHAEIGAYLLGLWGMPLDLLEATALHHQPSRTVTKGFTPLTAVHIANVLEHELTPDPDDLLSAKIDEAYLKEAGVFEKLEVWREAVAKRDFTKLDAKAKPAESAAKAASATAAKATPKPAPRSPAKPTTPLVPAAKTSVETLPLPVTSRPNWIYAAAAAAVVVAAGLIWVCVAGFGSKKSDAQSASTAKPAPVASTAGRGGTPAEASPTSGALVARARTEPATPTPTPTKTTTKEPSFSNLKLQGIFFSSGEPSAIVSGQMLHVNDHYAGATVVEIGRTSITFDYQGQRKVLVLTK